LYSRLTLAVLLEDLGHGLDELERVHRLDDEGVRPQAQGKLLVLRVGVRRGVENERDVPESGVLFPGAA
jgi:hypothetical protein